LLPLARHTCTLPPLRRQLLCCAVLCLHPPLPLLLACRVAAKGPGWIELERPLTYDLRMHWKPHLFLYAPTTQHSGFEDFTIQFKHGACQ